jgi:hypothetical protein
MKQKELDKILAEVEARDVEIKHLEAELEAARGERDKWRELEHAAIETAGFNAAQLAAATKKE